MTAAGRGLPPGGHDGPPDAGQRRSAVTDFEHNLVVTAGAGTGKTALLVERALNLIAGRDVPIHSLAAITFTDKAAAELRERLACALDDLRELASRDAPLHAVPRSEAGRAYRWLREDAGVAAADIARRALRALLDLDGASVGTIHAFCADILRSHPLQAGVDPDFVVDTGGAFDTLFERDATRFLGRELGPEARRPDLWRRVVAIPGGLPAARDVAGELAGFRLPGDAAGAGRPDAHPAARDVVGPEIDAIVDAIERLRREAAGMNPGMDRFLETARTLLREVLRSGPSSLRTTRAPLSLEEFLGKSIPAPGARLQGVEAPSVIDAATRARRIVKRLAAVDEGAIAAIVEAAAPLGAEARQSFLAGGLVSFDGLLRLTRDLLARQPAVRRMLARRHRALLVDEFQDTDPLQYEILFYLAEEEGEPAGDAFRARPAPGRLFIVGDPKQSIYRFRGADIEAYQRAVGHVLECGGRMLTLSASFRSPAGIVEPINRMFAAWLPSDGGVPPYQVPYEPIVSARGATAEGGARLEIWSVESEGGAPAGRRAEAERLAAWIAGALGRSEATGQPLRCRDIAVLLRALTHAGLYAQALRRAGIPFVVEGGREFYERPEVSDLIALLRAVANPNDAPAVLAVLRSVLGGVPDEQLARFAAAGGRFDAGSAGIVEPQAHPDVTRALRLLESLRARTRSLAVDEMVRAALEETPLTLLHAAAFEGAQRVANLAKLAAEAEDLARRGLSLEELLPALEDESRRDRDGSESPLADETLDAVRVLSVHKAKGLQYPVVFVPDIGHQERNDRSPGTEVAWVRLDTAGALAVSLECGVTNLAWVRHAEVSRRHEAEEEKRVFYVACTRAQERLILMNSNRGAKRAPWRDALQGLGYSVEGGFPETGSLAPDVLHRLVPPAPGPTAAAGASPDSGWSAAALAFEGAVASAIAGMSPPLRWPSGARDARQAGADETGDEAPAPLRERRRDGTGRSLARAAGSVFHAAMERWDLKDGARLKELLRQEAGRAVRERAVRGAPLPADRLLAEIESIADDFLRSPLPRRLAALAILGREVPILYRDDGGQTWTGACDLLFRDEDGVIVVADYKTDRVDGDPAAAAATYRDQLRVYLEAVSRAVRPEPVRGEILFVRSGDVVRLD